MDEYKKDDRGRSKAQRLTQTDPQEKVDSSTWTPSAPENAGVKTGARPLTKRLYKKGGKVIGADAMKRADRKPRKAGGRALTADTLINRNVREANEDREGIKHDGAFKKGGKAHKADGGSMLSPYGEKVKRLAEIKKLQLQSNPKTTDKNQWGDWHQERSRLESDLMDSSRRLGPTRKSGGKIHKLGGGMIGNNPVSDQNMAMGKAAGPMKKGGKIKHPDVAEDKALIKRMVKPEARTGRKSGGEAMHHKDCTCHMCSGGRTMKYAGGGIFSGNSKEKVPGAVGGRHARAAGGGFSDAFKAGRAAMLAGGPKTFEYNGKMYNTDLAPAAKSAGRGNSPTAGNFRDAMPPMGPQERIVGTELAPPQPVDASGGWNASEAARMGQANSILAAHPEMQRGPIDAKLNPNGYYSPAPEPTGYGALDKEAGDFGSWLYNTMRNADNPAGQKNGGRAGHKAGGRTKGTTTINIVMAPRGGQDQANMPNAPVMPPKPPMGVPVPPPQMAGGAPPMGGMPPQMPPQMPRATGGRTRKMVGGSLGNAGGMQPMQQQPMMGQPMMQQPMGYPMPRKSGGRTGYPIDSGAGGGNARLEKIDAYGLKPRGK